MINWQFWQKHQDTKLTDRLRITLRSQFHLDENFLDRLRFVGKSGQYAGRRVRNILIYDPQRISGGNKAIKGCHDLKNHRQAIMFEGHIDHRNDYVYLTDRRSGEKTAKTRKAAVVASSRQRL